MATAEHVVIEIERQCAEDSLISVLAQGEEGGRRYRALRAIEDAIRDRLRELDDAPPAVRGDH